MKENLVHQEKYKDFDIEIYQDIDPMSPRDWDNLGTMVCFHNRYKLGDDLMKTLGFTLNQEELKEWVKRKDVVSLPLYLYDHSGLTMNTTGFSCPWDSGQVGYIYVTYDEIRKNFNAKHVTKRLIERTKAILISEVREYDQYLIGNVYGYVVVKDGQNIDSCWGYIGDPARVGGALESAKEVIDSYHNQKNFVGEGI